jgi:hypothetical protein
MSSSSNVIVSFTEKELLFAILSQLKNPEDIILARMIMDSLSENGQAVVLKYITCKTNPYQDILPIGTKCYFDIESFGYNRYLSSTLYLHDYRDHTDYKDGFIPVVIHEHKSFDSDFVNVVLPPHNGNSEIITSISQEDLIPIDEFDLSRNQTDESEL